MTPKLSIPLVGRPPKILIASVEVAPFASVGGLSQVMYYLPKALQRKGADIRIFMPKFGLISEEDLKQMKIKMEYENLPVPVDADRHILNCNVKSVKLPESGVTVYFLENSEYYELRANVYGYADDPARWGLFQRGVLEFFRATHGKPGAWIPDIIHCNDWQTGLIPNYLKTEYQDVSAFKKVTTAFTVHNLAFQGAFNWRDISDAEYDDGKSAIPAVFDPRFPFLNSMRRGIMYADAVNTVSRKYSREILTKEFGEGLDQLLIESRDKLFGILNGLDYEVFDPETDKAIQYPFSARTAHKIRPLNKQALQEEFGLPVDSGKVVLGISYRLTGQKGIELITEVIKTVLQEFPVQLVVNGDGEGHYKEKFKAIQESFPGQVGLNLSANFTLPHLIFAGADIILLPSLFEPCGIVQMEAMRYGCVPVARAIGGLYDTVKDEVTGFTFTQFDPLAFFAALVRALEVYKHRELWQGIVTNCLKQDHSWEATANEYLKFYTRAQTLKDESKRPRANVLKYNKDL